VAPFYGIHIYVDGWLAYTAVRAGARQRALGEFLSLIEGRDLLLTHADKQIRQLQRKLAVKQASCVAWCLMVFLLFLALSEQQQTNKRIGRINVLPQK